MYLEPAHRSLCLLIGFVLGPGPLKGEGPGRAPKVVRGPELGALRQGIIFGRTLVPWSEREIRPALLIRNVKEGVGRMGGLSRARKGPRGGPRT